MNPYVMHINYCEITFNRFGKSVEEACKKAKEWGFDGIEFRGKVPDDLNLSETEYIDAILRGKNKYGIKHILFGRQAKGVSSSDPNERAKGIKDTIEFFKRVNDKLGVTLSNTFADTLESSDTSIPGYDYDRHGSAVATEDIWKYTAEGFSKIGEELVKIGVKLAFETHMNYLHDKPEPTKKLVDMINSPAIGVNMDFGNTVYFSEYPPIEDTIALYGDKLFYTHLKNSVGVRDAGRIPVALAEGEINHRLYLSVLKNARYSGPIGIEAPRGGDRELYARNDLMYIKTVADEIGFGLV